MIIDKNNIKILLFILILGLGIGYAYINSDLNINGTAQVNSAFGTSNCVNYSLFVHCSVSGLESYADKMGKSMRVILVGLAQFLVKEAHLTVMKIMSDS